MVVKSSGSGNRLVSPLRRRRAKPVLENLWPWPTGTVVTGTKLPDVPHYRISEASQFLNVSDDTLRRWIDAGRLSASTDDSGRRVVDGVELARLAQDLAGDISSPEHTSARNLFRGLVTKVLSDPVMSQVEVQCGPFRVVALISTEAVRELGLEPGVVTTARVKATNVVLDRTRQ